MSEVLSRTSELAVPAVPITRGPPRHTPRDSISDLHRPPRRPPSRSASRGRTPRGQGPNNGATPILADVPAGGHSPPPDDGQRRRSCSSLQFAIETDPVATHVAGDDTNISFDVEPSAGNREAPPRQSPTAVADDIDFRVESNSRRESAARHADPSQPRLLSTAASDIHFAVMQTPTENTHAEEEEVGEEAEGKLRIVHEESPAKADSDHGTPKNGSLSAAATPRSSHGSGAPASAPAPVGPTSSSPKDNAAPADQQIDSGEGEDPTAAPAAPRREPTRPRQPPQKTRQQLMNERPWRTASSGSAKGRTPSPMKAHGTKKTINEAGRNNSSPLKSREQMMSERPWRTGSPVTRTASPNWSAKPKKATAAARAERQPPTKQTDTHSESPRQRAPTPLAHPFESAPSTPLVPSAPSKRTADAAKPTKTAAATAPATTPPPVLLRSPWAVMAEEAKDWTDTVNQIHNLRNTLAVMRDREREVAHAVQRIEALEKEMKRVDRELYAARDAAVSLRGVDANGDPLLPPRPTANGGSPRPPTMGSGSSPCSPVAAGADYVTRLYPQSPRRAPEYVLGTNGYGRQPSVLSDEALSDSELDRHAEEVNHWRLERSRLRATKTALVQRNKDLKFHVRRGTNIKDISAVAVTSFRTPLERAKTGAPSHVDEFGYDVLTKLRLDAAEAQFTLDEARDAHIGAQAMARVRSRQLRHQGEDTRAQRDQRRHEFGELAGYLRESIDHARSLRLRIDAGDDSGDHQSQRRRQPEEIDLDDDEGARLKLMEIALPSSAPGAAEITNVEAKRDAARLLQLHIQKAEDILAKAKAHQREAAEAATKNSARSRSGSRSVATRG